MQPWPTAYTFFHRPGKEPMRVIVNRHRDVWVHGSDSRFVRAGRGRDVAEPTGTALWVYGSRG